MRKRTSEQVVPVINVPHRLEEIPGLGVIRARGLRKIGINTVADLRAASPDVVSTAPGLTPIKAHQVATYMEQFDADLLLSAAENEREFLQAHERAEALQNELLPRITASTHDELGTASTLLTLTIARLMTAPGASDFRGALLRQMARLARISQLLRTSTPERRRERAVSTIMQTVTTLNKAVAATDVDRKAQVRLSDALDAYADGLQDCLDDRSSPRKGSTS